MFTMGMPGHNYCIPGIQTTVSRKLSSQNEISNTLKMINYQKEKIFPGRRKKHKLL